MSRRASRGRAGLGLVAAALAACVGPPPTPEMAYYTLAVPGAPPQALPGPVQVDGFTTEAAYATPRLAYRTSPYRIQYYVFHRWAAGSPQRAVETALGDYLSRAPAPADGPPIRIGGTIRRIEEVDEPGGRRGVLAIDFRVEREGRPWLERSYEDSEPAEADTPEAVVAALSRALGRILVLLVDDLASAAGAGRGHAPALQGLHRHEQLRDRCGVLLATPVARCSIPDFTPPRVRGGIPGGSHEAMGQAELCRGGRVRRLSSARMH